MIGCHATCYSDVDMQCQYLPFTQCCGCGCNFTNPMSKLQRPIFAVPFLQISSAQAHNTPTSWTNPPPSRWLGGISNLCRMKMQVGLWWLGGISNFCRIRWSEARQYVHSRNVLREMLRKRGTTTLKPSCSNTIYGYTLSWGQEQPTVPCTRLSDIFDPCDLLLLPSKPRTT